MNVMMLPGPGPELAPLLRPAAPSRRWRAAWLTASVLLHLLLLLALLLTVRQPMPGPQGKAAPSVEMVFAPPSAPATVPAPPAPAAAAPQHEDVPTPGASEVSPTAPPDQTATQPGAQSPALVPAPAPEPVPPVAPPELAQPPPAPVEAPPEPTPAPAPSEATPVYRAPPQPPAPPAVRLGEPDEALLPPPVPMPEAPPRPLSPAPARPRPAPNPFAGALMLGGPLAFQQPPGRPMARGGARSRAIDLSLGAVSAAPAASGRYAAARAANSSRDWRSEVEAWYEAHTYYPAEAAMRGEDGTATVQVTVDRYGRLSNVELAATSGSPRLDAALMGMLRGAQVPPPPPEIPAPITTTFTLHYMLMR